MYPSTISALTTPLASDRLNSPSHSGIEGAQNTNITAIENFLGVEGASSTVGTLIYDVRSPGSNGGGHVQSANKGGTGQTSYSKGDLLIASSGSVLSKLSIGTDGQIIQANSSTFTGINWVNTSSPKLYTSSSVINAGSASASFLSLALPASTLGTVNAVRTTAHVSWSDSNNGSSIVAAVQFGGNALGSVAAIQAFGNSNLNGYGTIRHTMIANSATSQSHFLDFEVKYIPQVTGIGASEAQIITPGSVVGMALTTLRSSGTSSVNSSQTQTLGITARMTSGTMTLNGIVVEKIS